MSCEMIDNLNALAAQNHVKREPDIVLDDHPAVRYRSRVKQQAEMPVEQQMEPPAEQPGKQPVAPEALAADTPSHSALDFLEQNL